jgi:hypothetical protein
MYAKFLLYFTNILSSFTNQLFNILTRYLLIQGSLVIKLKSLRFTVSIMTLLTVTENLCHSFMDKIISSSLTNRIFNTLTRKRLSQEFLIIKLKSSLIKFLQAITNMALVRARLCKLQKMGALESHSQVIKFTSCLPMVGGCLRVLRLLPPLKLVVTIYLIVSHKSDI